MRKFQFFGLLLVILAAGCKPNYYVPNAQNVPMLREKGEVRLSAIAGGLGELQAAYQVKNNLGIMLNVGSIKQEDNEIEGNGGSGRLFEGGAGYSRDLGNKFRFEGYGLFAGGRMENHFNNPGSVDSTGTVIDPATYFGDIKASLIRLGIQPAIGYSGKYFEAIFSVRVSNLHFSGVQGNLKNEGLDEIAKLKDQSSSFLFEPALTLRAGWDPIKLQVQAQTSRNLSHRDFYQSGGGISIGLTARF